MTKLTNEEALKVLEALSSCKITGWDHGGPNMDYDEKKISEAVKLLQRPATPAPAGWVMKSAEDWYFLMKNYMGEGRDAELLFIKNIQDDVLSAAPAVQKVLPMELTEAMKQAMVSCKSYDHAAQTGIITLADCEGIYNAACAAAPAVSNPEPFRPFSDDVIDSCRAICDKQAAEVVHDWEIEHEGNDCSIADLERMISVKLMDFALPLARAAGMPRDAVSNPDGWRTIESAPKDGTRCWLAAWVIPSEVAQNHGSKPYWSIADGCFIKWPQGGGVWTSILGGDPQLWMTFIEPPAPAEPKE